MANQTYSSFHGRERFETITQTTLPPETWPPPPALLPPETWPPPALPSPMETRRHIFTIGNDVPYSASPSSSRQTICCISKDVCVISRLIISCMCSSVVTLFILGCIGWTALGIYSWTSESNVSTVSDLWRYMDETTLCVTLSGKDLQHSGCAQYIFHDISETTNYTCCVRDSRHFSFLYQMVNVQKRGLTAGVKNSVCTHSKSVKEVAANGSLLWSPSPKCEINNRKDITTSMIGIDSSDMYSIYLLLSIRFDKTVKTLPYHKIQVKLYCRHNNHTYVEDELLLHKTLQVRKEHQSFDSILMHGTFHLRKGDQLFVEVQNHKFVYTVNTVIDVLKVLKI